MRILFSGVPTALHVISSRAMTRLADLVTASQELSGTSSRSRKVAILAELLGRLSPNEVAIAVGFLSGVPRQGRVGIGYSTIYGVDAAAPADPSIALHELDRCIVDVEAAMGTGSGARRKQLLQQVLDRATAAEADFIRRLFTGELRQGALAWLMVDAVAWGAEVPGEITRRALRLSGDLTRTAEIALTRGEEGLREVGFE